MWIKILLFFLIFSFFVVGCTPKKPLLSKSFLVVLKTKELRFADTAFVNIWEKEAEISAYVVGKNALEIHFGGNVCVDGICMDKKEFNSRFLHYTYYNNLFLDVLKKKRLSLDGDFADTDDGFVQKAENKNFNIIYQVSKKEVFFRDRKNNIIIKLKEL